MGGSARILGLILLAVLAAPALALVPGMLVDRGADGAPRGSAFPAALVVLDPLVWRCVRNSAAVALAVTVGSLVVGTGLGVLLGRRQFWGRAALGTLALAPLAIGPTWLAPGVVGWIGGDSGWQWLAARSALGQPLDDWARWGALAWVGLAVSTPLVILATGAGLAWVDPAWLDSARGAGAGRWRTWLDVTWPTIRPDLGRIAGAIFALSLVEPAGPTVLGLRRTLAVELADAAARSPAPQRAAALGAIAVAIAALGQALFARWGGPGPGPIGWRDVAPIRPRAGARLGAVAALVLIAWAAVALGPVAALGRAATTTLAGRPIREVAGAVVAALAGPGPAGWLANSAITATLAVGLALLATRARGGAREGPGGPRWGGLGAVPPLALAAGALAIPPLLDDAASLVGRPMVAAVLRPLRAELSPGRGPGLLLVLVLAAAHLPALRGRRSGAGRPDPAGAIDAALLAGASARDARRLVRPGATAGLGRTALIAWAWASTDLASAWLLAPLPERQTAAVAALDRVAAGADLADPRLLGLFLTLTLVRLVGLALLVQSTRPGRSLVEPAKPM